MSGEKSEVNYGFFENPIVSKFVLPVSVTVIGSLLVAWITKACNLDGSPPPTPKTSSSSISTSSQPPVVDTNPSETGEPRASGGSYLTELNALEKGSDISLGENVNIEGTSYPYSILHHSQYFSRAATGVVKIELNRKYQTFITQLAVREPDQQATFIVIGDGNPLMQEQVEYGNSKSVEVDVSNIQLLELHTAVDGALSGSPADLVLEGANTAGGVRNVLPNVVWGSPRVSSG